MKELRDYQADAMERLRASVAGGRKRVMMQSPTGSGKTLMAADVTNGALRKGKRVVFTVPAISLVDQTMEMFWNEGIRDCGVIQANHVMTDWSKPVQIASVQTLARRELPKADVVIVDEAHKVFEVCKRWMALEEWQKVPFIGLSATPWTRGLGKLYQELIIVRTTEELIRDGYLSPFRVFAPAHPDLKGVRVQAGDYHEGDLSEAMNKEKLTGDIVATWLDRAGSRPTFCFAVDRAHAKSLHDKFAAAGVAVGYMDAYTESDERAKLKRMFHAGEIKVLCNVDVLTLGVDWDVRCIVYARPTRSEIRHVQCIGRGLRKAEGKADLLILDHSDTHLKLGFVTDIVHEALDRGEGEKKQKPREQLPKECPKCAGLRPPRAAICPHCGFKPEVVSRIEHANGELVEVNGHRVKERATMAEKGIFLSELKAYGLQHGYKPGWAMNKFREKFDVWPDWSIKDQPPAKYPSAKTVMWIRSRAIAWAKSKRNPANA